jgi:hypothetical protein
MKKFLILVFVVLFVLFTNGCNRGQVSVNSSIEEENLDEDNQSPEESSPRNGKLGKTSKSDRAIEIPKWDINKNNTKTININFDDFNQSYKFTAPESGNYRFMFDIDNANYSYNVRLLEKNYKTIRDCDNNNSFTEELKKDKIYIIEVLQAEGFPKATIKIGIPKAEQEIGSNGLASDVFTFQDQEDVYSFTAPISGKYGFDLSISDVNLTYKVKILDNRNKEVEDKECDLYNSDISYFNPELKKGEKYKLVVGYYDETPDYDVKYSIKINTPNEMKSIKTNSINDEFTFYGQENIYDYYPSKTADYKIDVDNLNEEMEYKISVFDNKNKEVCSLYNYNESTLKMISGKKYKIIIEQQELLGKYKFKFVKTNLDY